MDILTHFHLFIVHGSIWIALIIAADVHVNGAPALDRIPKLLASAAVLGSLMGLLTAHAHGHYLTYLRDL